MEDVMKFIKTQEMFLSKPNIKNSIENINYYIETCFQKEDQYEAAIYLTENAAVFIEEEKTENLYFIYSKENTNFSLGVFETKEECVRFCISFQLNLSIK